MYKLSWSSISNMLFKYPPKGFGVFTLGLISLFQGCALSIPEGIKPVSGFDVNRYLGHWYEVARLDNRFQRGLEQVTATYTLRKDGSICVENAGWNVQSKAKETAIDKAKFVSDKQIGHLKVSFWGPFYSSYVIFHLEADYSVAMVCGSSKDYCWILAKDPALSVEDLTKYRKIAEEHGFAVEQFIYTSGAIAANTVDY